MLQPSASTPALAELLRTGLAEHRRGHLASARKLYEKALAAAPGHPDALHLLGVCRFQAGEREAGCALMEAATQAAPSRADYWRSLAQAQRRLGQAAPAEASYRRLLHLTGPDRDSELGLAELLGEQRRFPEALALLERTAARGPNDPTALNALGTCLLQAGRPEAALPRLDAAIAAAPNMAQAHHNRATALGDLGRIVDSAAAARAALAADPGLPGAHWHLGLAAYDAGEREGAVTHFAQAAKLAPGLAVAHGYLGVTLDELGQEAEADAALRRAAEISPGLASLAECRDYRKAEPARAAVRGFGFKASVLRHALAAAAASAPEPGLVLEFGVFTGRSIRVIAAEVAGPVHGFDSFEGLPEDWIEGETKGAYDAGGRLPEVPANVELLAGWFEDSLPPFLAAHPGPLRFANIDCDLYSSTRFVLDALAPRLVPGSVLVFDEYFAYPGWREHEYKAFQETVAARGLRYRYLSLNPFTRQAAVCLL